MARQASRRVGGGREQGPAVAAADTHTPESSSCNYLAAAAAAADCFSLSDSATLHAWKHRQRSVCKSALGHMPPDSLPRRRRSRRRLLPLQQIHAELPGLDAAAPSSIAIAAVWSTADSTGSPSGCSSCSTGSCCLAEVPAGGTCRPRQWWHGWLAPARLPAGQSLQCIPSTGNKQQAQTGRRQEQSRKMAMHCFRCSPKATQPSLTCIHCLCQGGRQLEDALAAKNCWQHVACSRFGSSSSSGGSS